jgi:hypothetical protein
MAKQWIGISKPERAATLIKLDAAEVSKRGGEGELRDSATQASVFSAVQCSAVHNAAHNAAYR